MSDNTEKDFGDFLVTQLGKLEPQAPHPPTYTDTRAQSYVRRKPDMVTDRSTHGHRYTDTHGHTQTQVHTQTQTHTDTNSPKQSLCTQK